MKHEGRNRRKKRDGDLGRQRNRPGYRQCILSIHYYKLQNLFVELKWTFRQTSSSGLLQHMI